MRPASSSAVTAFMLAIGLFVFLALPGLAFADNGGDHADGWPETAAAALAAGGAAAAAGMTRRYGREMPPQFDEQDSPRSEWTNSDPDRRMSDPELGGGSDRGFQPQRDLDDSDWPNSEPPEEPRMSPDDSPPHGLQPPGPRE